VASAASASPIQFRTLNHLSACSLLEHPSWGSAAKPLSPQRHDARQLFPRARLFIQAASGHARMHFTAEQRYMVLDWQQTPPPRRIYAPQPTTTRSSRRTRPARRSLHSTLTTRVCRNSPGLFSRAHSDGPVLVTREEGKNGPLVKRLAALGVQARPHCFLLGAHSPGMK